MNESEWISEGRGGVFVGDFYATWPFASLRVGTDQIEITVPAAKFFSGFHGVMTSYTFRKKEVQSLQKRFALFGACLQIEHVNPDYPKKFIVNGSKRLIAAIEAALSSTETESPTTKSTLSSEAAPSAAPSER